MFKTKKIFSILLALCFVLSVTAVAASAHEDNEYNHFGDHDEHNHFGDHDEHHHGHFHPGHWDRHRVGHREFRHNQWTVVYVYEKVFVDGHWGY